MQKEYTAGWHAGEKDNNTPTTPLYLEPIPPSGEDLKDLDDPDLNGILLHLREEAFKDVYEELLLECKKEYASAMRGIGSAKTLQETIETLRKHMKLYGGLLK